MSHIRNTDQTGVQGTSARRVALGHSFEDASSQNPDTPAAKSPNPFHHPDFDVIGVPVETDAGIHVQAKLKNEIIGALRPENMHRHDKRPMTIADIPIYSDFRQCYLPVSITVEIPRFKDPRTGKSVSVRPASISLERLMTSRLLGLILRDPHVPDAEIAHRVCLSESTVRMARAAHMSSLADQLRPIASEIIAIDEAHIGGVGLGIRNYSRNRGLGVITAAEGNRILSMTPYTDQANIEAGLREIAHLDRVRFVAIDMNDGYRRAIRNVLPQATIIVDRYQITRQILDIVQDARKRARKLRTTRDVKLGRQHWLVAQRGENLNEDDRRALQEWLAQDPILAEAYRLKENFCAIYESCASSTEALAAYAAWKSSFPQPDGYYKSAQSRLALAIHDLFAAFVAGIEEWSAEVFAWFDAPRNSAGKRPSLGHAQSRNDHIKDVYSRSNGMKFETLRLKMIFGSNAAEFLVTK